VFPLTCFQLRLLSGNTSNHDDPWNITATLMSDQFSDMAMRGFLFIILCAAASPSPISMPLAAFFAYQPPIVAEVWGKMHDSYSFAMLLVIQMSIAFVLYFVHGFGCLAFDSIWRPQIIEQFKIQKGKGGLPLERVWKV